MEDKQENPMDAEIIKEFMENGWTRHGAEEALKSIKAGMEDVRAGRVHKVRWREM